MMGALRVPDAGTMRSPVMIASRRHLAVLQCVVAAAPVSQWSINP